MYRVQPEKEILQQGFARVILRIRLAQQTLCATPATTRECKMDVILILRQGLSAKKSAPAASVMQGACSPSPLRRICNGARKLRHPLKCCEPNFAHRGALNDDLKAVLGNGWGVGYAYMYIECHGDRARGHLGFGYGSA